MIDILSLDMMPVDHAIQPKGVIFSVQKLGGELMQWYYQNANTWEPTRKGTATTAAQPLLLKPDIALVQPDNHRKVVPEYECFWYVKGDPAFPLGESPTEDEIKYGKLVTNTTDDTNALYVLVNGGKDLRVKKDVMPQSPVRLCLRLRYAEPEGGGFQFLEWMDTLAASFKADTVYSLQWISPARQIYNPVGGGSSSKTFQLKAVLGDEDVTATTKFFWYYMRNTGTAQSPNWVETLINDTSYPHLAYVSGQGTASLVLDALKTDNLAILCKVGKTTSAASPTEPVVAKGCLYWSLPQMRGHAATPNGCARRDGEHEKEFQLAVQVGGRGGMVADAVRKANFCTRWEKQENGTISTVAYGDNPNIRVFDIDSAVIRPVPSLLGPDERVIADDGSVVTADDNTVVTERS